MALAVGGIGAACLSPSSSARISVPEGLRWAGVTLRRRGGFRAMVQQQTFQGASATYAKEMERLSAKESLLLAVSEFPIFRLLDSWASLHCQFNCIQLFFRVAEKNESYVLVCFDDAKELVAN